MDKEYSTQQRKEGAYLVSNPLVEAVNYARLVYQYAGGYRGWETVQLLLNSLRNMGVNPEELCVGCNDEETLEALLLVGTLSDWRSHGYELKNAAGATKKENYETQ